jgi:hypothetical protein
MVSCTNVWLHAYVWGMHTLITIACKLKHVSDFIASIQYDNYGDFETYSVVELYVLIHLFIARENGLEINH